MGNRPSTILLCGFGAFGAVHAEAWRRALPDARLTIADPSPAARRRAQALVPESDIAAEPEAFLADADIVDVVTPPDDHYAAVRMAIDAGKPAIVEKPAVRRLDHARDLADRARAAGCPVQVQFVLRAHPLVRRAAALLAQGAIGRVVKVEGDFSGWKRMRADSSLIENDGVHFLDLMSNLIGGPPVAADARAHHHLGGPVADEVDIDLGFPGEIAGHLRLGVLRAGTHDDPFVPGAVTTKRLRLIGDAGTIDLDFNAGRLFLARVRYEPTEDGWHPVPGDLVWEQPPAVTPVALLAETFTVFLAALDNGTPETGWPVLCNLSEGAVSMLETMSAIETALTRQPAPMIEIRRPA
ncbi:Gfo/Idh/MocA family oxidoreductase [Fodinicurvata sp. EGI_FJ10296]|uniref:Gfo/Idh/MocA family protein n=1 Tax=Fodinicurvata sp. EGI_FJ10296 TaxID=3231908 RepID=UPI0034549F0E